MPCYGIKKPCRLATTPTILVLRETNVNSLSESELRELINRCLGNHRKSQETVYNMFYGKMLAVCHRYTNNDDEAKDMLQDAFIKLFKSMEKFNFEGSFEGWVRKIVVNTAIDHVRKAKHDFLLANKSESMEQIENQMEADEVDDAPFALEIDMEDVRKGMQQLSTAYRTVFNLYVFESYSHQQIAETLDINIGTSKSNLAKARANLKKILIRELKNKHGKRT